MTKSWKRIIRLNTNLEYNENVLAKVMESNDIEEDDKDAFLTFAQDFNADGNTYLKKKNWKPLLIAWNSQSEDVDDAVENDEDEVDDEINADTVQDIDINEDTEVSPEEDDDVEAIESGRRPCCRRV